MADPKDPTQEIQAQVLDGIRKSQEAVIDGMRSWAETVQQLVPGAAQTAVPGASQLPSPTEVVGRVAAAGMRVANLDTYRCRDDAIGPGLVLGYGNLADAQVEEAVALLATTVAGASVAYQPDANYT
jgi:DNA-binding transcriptional MocR family regulator